MDSIRGIRRVLWITMGLNIIATLAKLVVGFLTGSLSLIADGFDSVFDAASNVIGLVGIRVASRPADQDHPYGHRKAETMTALIIAMLLFITTWELITSAVARLRDPSSISAEANLWSFGALLVSIVIHATVVWYEMGAGRRLRSDVLVADAMHTRADILISVAVGVGLILVRLGFHLADPILALIVAGFIAKIGIDILRETIPTLMDQNVIPVEEVEKIIQGVPGVVSSHHVRSRGHEAAMYADLHIRVDPDMSTEQAHAIAHEVQRRLREHEPNIQDVTIHVEPARQQGTQQADEEQITIHLRRLADGLGLGVHDIWANEVDGRYAVDVHLEADSAFSLEQAHELASTFEGLARERIPDLARVTTHIEPKGQVVQGPKMAEERERIIQQVEGILAGFGNISSYHRVEAYVDAGGWTVSMHCRMPGQINLAEAHRLSGEVEDKLRAGIPALDRIIIHTEPEEGR
jgi:cation diffusion facilitator family transporter